jgi:type VI secretion system protein ImpK
MNVGPVLTRPLADGFAELMSYVLAFRQTATQRQPVYEEVRAEILRLLKKSEAVVNGGQCSLKEYTEARYALCAWIDESILSSSWTHKNRWRPERLERMYYLSADAGETFYSRLKSLEAPEQGVREIYTLCLAFGFKGRYCASDDAFALDQIKDRNIKLLYNSAGDSPTISDMEKNFLFPEAYPEAGKAAPRPISGTSWHWSLPLAGPLAALVTLFLIYRFTLDHIGLNLLKAVRP